MERNNLLKMAGYTVDTIWECEWCDLKKDLDNKKELETKARQQNIKPRDALFGGRTEAFKSYHKCTIDEIIGYVDICSLYPTVNACDDYAVGFKQYVDLTIEDIINDKFIGLVKCDVIPPKDLYRPVLPDNTDGKLLFHLNPMYEKTWTSVELKLAIQKGYKITKIHSATQYKRFKGLMKEYVQNFLQMKIENNAVLTQEECDKLNEHHKKLGFTFIIKPENTKKNPGLKQVAKICLNSLWGKFGQRCGMDDYDFFTDYNKMINKFVNNNKIIPQTWNIINKNCVELRFSEDQDMVIESDYISEITACFTTANARVRLYKMLDYFHPTQVLYCDTDSVFYRYDKNNPLHKDINKLPDDIQLGKGLGQWEDEFDGKDHIVEMVIGGAKSYAYITASGKVVIKQKGVTLDKANDSVVTFNALVDMVLNCQKIETKPRHRFEWDSVTKEILTKQIPKSIKSTISEKRNVNGLDTYPFGYEGIIY